MAPKRSVASVKKLSLKAKALPKSMTLDEAVAVVKQASNIYGASSMDFEKMVSESTLEDIKELDNYLRHGRANTPKKLEAFGEYLTMLRKMTNLRSWLDELIKKSCDFLHDDAILKFGGSPEDFDFEEMKAYISEKIGEKGSMTDL